ncbi:unnamed protein product [Alternaria alternata]
MPSGQSTNCLPQHPAPSPLKTFRPPVESAYYRKCIDLRRRITDIEENNDGTRLRITRLNRGIQKMRLERAFLLEQLNKHMEYNVDDSDRSSSPPPTPTDKPLRSKRSHNRKGTPPLGGSAEGGAEYPGPIRASPEQLLRYHRRPHGDKPHTGANGAPPTLPPLHSLPPLQPQQQQPAPAQRAYFDPAYDEQRPTPASNEEAAARPRAYSGAAQQPPTTDSAPPPPQNGDTEMTDVSFTAVNR